MPSPAKRAASKRQSVDPAAEVAKKASQEAQKKPEPQHPKSAKAHYLLENKFAIMERHGLVPGEVDKLMKAAWAEFAEMDAAAQEPYIKMADDDKARYAAEITDDDKARYA